MVLIPSAPFPFSATEVPRVANLDNVATLNKIVLRSADARIASAVVQFALSVLRRRSIARLGGGHEVESTTESTSGVY